MKPRAPLPHTAFTLPAKFYTDPRIFAREMEIFFRDMWVYAGRLDELPDRGSFVTFDVAGESLVIVRTDEADGVKAFYNLCRHRGTRLCTDGQGRFGGAIQCPYHAWTYDYDGHLIGAPHMDDVAHFRKQDYPLHTVQAGVWDGLVFVKQAPGGQTLAEQLGPLPDKFRAWRMGDLRRAGQIVYDLQTNWKLILQNYSECLHCPNLHPRLNQLSHYLSGENEPLQPGYMGGRMRDLSDEAETMSMSGARPRATLPGVPASECRFVYYYAIFPNLLLTPHPDYLMTHAIWPIAPDRTRVICEWHFHPDEMAKPGFSTDDVVAFWDMTNKQDW